MSIIFLTIIKFITKLFNLVWLENFNISVTFCIILFTIFVSNLKPIIMNPTPRELFLKKIEETNELFDNSTKAQKRVMIAQDCIDRIKVNMFNVRKGMFIDVISDIQDYRVNKQTINELECRVCAKGGLFASYVGRVNKLDVINRTITNDEGNTVHKKLLEIFSLRQLAIIELAFEGEKFIHSIDIRRNVENTLKHFYIENYHDADKRLIAICENIIKNKGIFKL